MPKKNDPGTSLGREIREARERLRYSQEALGELLSVSGTIISRWEKGVHKPPMESLARFSDIAGTTEAERDELYARWMRLAGHRVPQSPAPSRAGDPAQAGNHPPATLEGAMGRAIIDEVRDPEQRLHLVLQLRSWAQQSPEGGADNGQVLDAAPSMPALPAGDDAQKSPETSP